MDWSDLFQIPTITSGLIYDWLSEPIPFLIRATPLILLYALIRPRYGISGGILFFKNVAAAVLFFAIGFLASVDPVFRRLDEGETGLLSALALTGPFLALLLVIEAIKPFFGLIMSEKKPEPPDS